MLVFCLVERGGVLSGLHFCRGRRCNIRLGIDVCVVIHWSDDVLFFDVCLLLPVDDKVSIPFVLYREFYGYERVRVK